MWGRHFHDLHCVLCTHSLTHSDCYTSCDAELSSTSASLLRQTFLPHCMSSSCLPARPNAAVDLWRGTSHVESSQVPLSHFFGGRKGEEKRRVQLGESVPTSLQPARAELVSVRLSRPSVIGRAERCASLPPPPSPPPSSPTVTTHHPIASPREPFTALPLPGCSFSAVAAVCTSAACAALCSLHPEQHLAVFHRGEARVPRSWEVSLHLSPSLPPSLLHSLPPCSLILLLLSGC